MAWYDVRQFSWLTEHEPPSVSLARGVQAGAQIANTMLRAKQVQIEQSDSILRATKELADRQNMNAINEGFAALSGTMADISKNGAFGDPSAKQRFFDVVKRYPFVVRTPGFAGFVDAFKTAEQTAARAELSSVMSSMKGDYSPENEVIFWGFGAKRPELMPEMEKLHAATFKHAADAKFRKELLQITIGGREDLEATKQQHRMESLTTRLDRMADMKLDDQDFKTQFEGLQQEHRLERDKLKVHSGDSPRLNLTKSDEIAYRNELAALLTGLNQGILEMGEYEAKREKVYEKFKSRAINQPADTNPAPGPLLRFQPDGSFK